MLAGVLERHILDPVSVVVRMAGFPDQQQIIEDLAQRRSAPQQLVADGVGGIFIHQGAKDEYPSGPYRA